MELDRDGNGMELNVYKVAIADGTIVHRLAKGNHNVWGYTTDLQGRVGLRYSLRKNLAFIDHRKAEGSPWERLFEAHRDEDFEFTPITFGADPNRLFVKHIKVDGFSEILEYDLATKSVADRFFSRPNVELVGVKREQYPPRIIGAFYADEYWKDHYKDPAYQTIQMNIKRLLPGTHNRIESSGAAETVFVVEATSPQHPGTYYLFRRGQDKISKIADRNIIPLKPDGLGVMKSITYTARDGTKIPAFLTTPPHGKTPFPMVVLPHAGPTSRDYLEYNYQVQFLASRGYAVLQPQFRGSRGYGESFRKAGNRQWGLLMQDDVTDGAREMIQLGVADSERMCILGRGYGGYVAMMGAVTTSDLFRCVISYGGIADVDRYIKQHSVYKFYTDNPPSIGSRRNDRDKLHDTSPINNIDAVAVPILLVHGDKDLAVDIAQSRVMAKALKRAKKPYKLVILKDGNHRLELEHNRIRYLKEIGGFLEEHIGG